VIGTIFKNPLALFYAVVVHAALLAVLVVSFDWTDEDDKPKLNVVEATVVDESKVRKQIETLKKKEQEKIRAEQERQQKLEQDAAKAKQAREQEEKRLAAAKKKREIEAREHEKTKQQRLAEEKQEKKRIADLKQKREVEAKKQKELEQKRKAEEQRLAKAQKEKERAEAAAKAAEEKRKREDMLSQMQAEEEERKKRRMQEEQKERERQMAQEQQALDVVKEQQAMKTVDKYTAMIRQKIEQNWRKPSNVRPGMSSTVSIQLIPSGDVINVQTVESSGDSLFDRSVETAVRKSEPFPLPAEPGLFERFRKINLKFSEVES